jgi:hypothetical protein
MWSSILAEKAPEPLPEGCVREQYVEDLLEPARSPRMPTNLMERLAEQQERLRERIRAKELIG